MKKALKWLVVSLLVVASVLGSLPQAFAQVSVKDVLVKIQESNKLDITSLHVNFTASAEYGDGESGVSGKAEGDVQFDMSNDLLVAAMMNISALGTNQSVGAIIKDNQIYVQENGVWHLVSNESDKVELNDVKQQFQDVMTHYKETAKIELTDDVVAVYEKLFDATETDSEYVLTLKSDLDPATEWANIEAAVDLEAFKEEVKKQVIKQNDAQGTEVSNEELTKMVDTLVSEAFFTEVLNAIQTLSMAYNKETGLLTSFTITGDVDINKFMSLVPEEDATAETEDVPPMFVKFDITLNIDKVNETFEVETPEVTESTESETATETTTAE